MDDINQKNKLYHFIQIRFNSKTRLNFTDYPELADLATWFAKTGSVWTCRNKHMEIDEFKEKFYRITQTDETQVTISDGGHGQGVGGAIGPMGW